MYTYDSTTFELTEARLCLKPGLHFGIQRSRHGNWYRIEDESRGSFYRIGPAEYTFLSMLDGKTTMASAMATTCSLMGGSALTEKDAIQLCKWLVESGLAQTDSSAAASRIADQRESKAKQQSIQKLNPISIRIPLWNPDKLVTTVTRYTGWLFSWPFALIWIFTCVYALLSVMQEWDRLFTSSVQVFSRDGMVWMIGTWLVLKAIHELAHGVACKKLGGDTGSFGILFLLMIPLPYIDVTSSWRFPNKYHRILVAASGMIAEIFIAAIATIVWCHSGPGIVAFHASNIMLAASLHTLLFNANPLLKFDGYHMLADWLEIPNFGTHGQKFVSGIGRKVFYGLSSEPVRYTGWYGQVIRVYGVAAFIWRVLLCLVLGLAAANLFPGIGLIIALMASVLWLAMPTYRIISFIVKGTEFEQPDRTHFAKVTGGIATALLLAAFLIPAPSVITAPLVVEYQDLEVIRNEASGFVQAVLVQPDQQVKAGDVLVLLSNPDIETQRIETQIKLRESEIRMAANRKAEDIGAMQMEQESVDALAKQLVEIEKSYEMLSVRASVGGHVVANDLDRLTGSFLEIGTEILSIGDEQNKRAVAMISQDHAGHLNGLLSQTVDVRVWGHDGLESAVVQKINPRGQDSLPHFAFAGMYGGPLNVANRNQLQDRSSDQPSESNEPNDLMLIDPRVKVNVIFDSSTSQQLFAGQTGIIHMRGRSGKLGGYLVDNVRRWFSDNLTTSHGL